MVINYLLGFIVVMSVGLIACDNHHPQPAPSITTEIKPATTTVRTASVLQADSSHPKVLYPWLAAAENQLESALSQQIPTPEGYSRGEVAEGSFAEWLRYLPLQPKGAKVLLYNAEEKPYQDGAYRVVNIDIGKSDLQQCADAVMRLKAEYHYSLKEYDKIHFNYTSGDKVAFDDWRKGRQPRISGSKVSFTSATGNIDNSYTNFQKYLRSVFMYAGTASLAKELQPKNLSDIQIGDVFIKGGFPGHAVLVVDMAVNQKGEKIFLLAQSYMPAQSIHILNNFNDNKLSPWYSNKLENTGNQLLTPEWTFEKDALKAF